MSFVSSKDISDSKVLHGVSLGCTLVDAAPSTCTYTTMLQCITMAYICVIIFIDVGPEIQNITQLYISIDSSKCQA